MLQIPRSDLDCHFIFQLLDVDQNGALSVGEFTMLTALVNVVVRRSHVKQRKANFRRKTLTDDKAILAGLQQKQQNRLQFSKIRKQLRRILNKGEFKAFILCLVVLNLVIYAGMCCTVLMNSNFWMHVVACINAMISGAVLLEMKTLSIDARYNILATVQHLILVVLIIELIVRFSALGPRAFFKHFRSTPSQHCP